MNDLKIVSYNLFRGAQVTRNELVLFLNQESPDIVCLQEVNGWQANDFEVLKDVAQKINMTAYVYGDSHTDYKLVTLSKYPIIDSTIYKDGVWHSMIDSFLKVDGKDLRVINIHLNPNSEILRKNEIENLLLRLDENVPALILGDFNSISRQDRYPDDLRDQLRVAGIDKFGENELRYDVTDLLESSGYIDIGASFNIFANTVPTRSNIDKNHIVPLRLDYIYGNQAVKDNIKNISVVKSDLTDIISDHYPISVSIRI